MFEWLLCHSICHLSCSIQSHLIHTNMKEDAVVYIRKTGLNIKFGQREEADLLRRRTIMCHIILNPNRLCYNLSSFLCSSNRSSSRHERVERIKPPWTPQVWMRTIKACLTTRCKSSMTCKYTYQVLIRTPILGIKVYRIPST